MKKLSRGRIDAFLVEEFSGKQAIRNSSVNNIKYDANYPVFASEAVMVVEKSDMGKTWASEISNILQQMKKDGSYNRIMKNGGES